VGKRISLRPSRRKERYKAVLFVENLSQASEALQAKDALVVVQRGRPRWLKMRCPCGCGEIISLNLDRAAGESWHLVIQDGRVGLFPSVWRDSGCQSHFILWRNVAYFCGTGTRRRSYFDTSEEGLFGFLRLNDIDPTAED
jgi:hypothetical protein